jgi:hypothetical protein
MLSMGSITTTSRTLDDISTTSKDSNTPEPAGSLAQAADASFHSKTVNHTTAV